AGNRLTIAFNPPAEVFRIDLFCRAEPTIATIISSDGKPHPAIRLVKGPLQTGSIAYVARGIAFVLLDHSNREAMLLRIDWDSDASSKAISLTAPSNEQSKATMTREQLAGILYARTAGWRALPDKVADLEQARSQLAASLLSSGILSGNVIVPNEDDLRHPI